MNRIKESALQVELPRARATVEGRSCVAGPIRVAVISRQRLIGEALTALLGNDIDIEIVGQAPRGAEVVGLHDSNPNVILVDVPTLGREDLQLLRTIRQESPDSKLLLLTGAADEALIRCALSAGARGYVSKEAGAADLRKAIRGVNDGDVWVERGVLLRWLKGEVSAEALDNENGARGGALTAREREILRLLASGGTNKDIARALYISDKTVKTHLNNIFRKLQVTRRLQAVLYAVRQGLQ